MHSVLVFGDVRTHQFFSAPAADKRTDKDAPIVYGGAILLSSALKAALDELYPIEDGADEVTADHPKPEVYFIEDPKQMLGADPNPLDLKPLGFEYLDWELVKTRLVRPKKTLLSDDIDSRQYRLQLWQKRPLGTKNLSEREDSLFPMLTKNTLTALERYQAKGKDAKGCFDPRDKDDRPWCPDVVVFDDLDDCVRSMVIRKVGDAPANSPAELKATARMSRKVLF